MTQKTQNPKMEGLEVGKLEGLEVRKLEGLEVKNFFFCWWSRQAVDMEARVWKVLKSRRLESGDWSVVDGDRSPEPNLYSTQVRPEKSSREI